ncbi:MAG: TonB-dependent receptor [Pseudomonadota bacterium]
MFIDSSARSLQGFLALRFAAVLLAAHLPLPDISANAQEVQRFDIAQQPLDAALTAFGLQSGLQVSADPSLFGDLGSQGVSGSVTAEQALTALLSGTGVGYRFDGPNTVVIEASVVQPDDGVLQLDQILVQGELQTRTLQDTQTSVAVITGEELDRRDDFDLYDVIERTPNVTSSFNERGFAIRGVDQRGPTAAGNGLVINTQVDGATLPDNLTSFFGPYSTWDLEQVEILRGPQSTQQGRNALAGAIVIRSADPTYDLAFKARGDVAARDTVGGAFAANLPLIDETLAFRVSAEHQRTDGWVTNPTLGVDDYDFREQTTVRAKLRFDPADTFSALLSFSHVENVGGEDLVDGDLFPDRRVNFSELTAEEGANHNIANLRLSYDIGPALTLESESTYYFGSYRRIEDSTQSPEPDGFLDRDQESRSIEQEVRLSYSSEALSGVIGGYFANVDLEDFTSTTSPGDGFGLPGFLIDSQFRTETDVTNLAIFGEAEIRVLPNLSVIAGARYDREERRFESVGALRLIPPIPGAPLPPDDLEVSDTTYDAFLPKAGLVYDWTEDFSTGITIQRGYRAGGSQRNGITGEVSEFDPEFTWNYELSVRSQWLDRRLTANANVFYTQWRDQQVNVSGPSGNVLDFTTVNAGKSRLYGGEVEIDFSATDNLALFASAGLAQTEFLDLVDNGEDLSGNRFPLSPRVTAAFGGAYLFDNGIEIRADASYTGAAFQDAQNTASTEIDRRFLVNASLGYETEAWGVSLWARNLLDNDYILQTTSGNVRTGEPLTVGVTATLRFP